MQAEICACSSYRRTIGLAAGGGYEVLAHCDKLVVHTTSVMGLVEAGVGVVPGGGGIKKPIYGGMMQRALGMMPLGRHG